MNFISRTIKILLLAILFLLTMSTSAAVSSDSFSDSLFTEKTWLWAVEPATWSVNDVRGSHLVVQSHLSTNPSYSNFNYNTANYLYQPLSDENIGNYTIQIDSSKMGLNYETISLIIAEDNQNMYAVNVKHDYGYRRISVTRFISGIRTELHSGTSYLLTSASNLQLKIQLYDDNGIQKMNVYAISDTGRVDTLIAGRTVELNDLNTVGIAFSRGANSGQSTSNVAKFVYNDIDPDKYQIPTGAIAYNSGHNTIYINDYQTDLPEIYHAMRQLYNESFVHNNIIHEVSPGVWKLVPRLEFKDNSKLYLNSSTCTELRVCYSSENYMSLEGNIDAEDVKITGWLNSANAEREFSNGLPYFLFFDTKMNNVTFEKNGKINIGTSIPSITIQDPVINNLIIKNYRMGLIIRANNATIDGIYMSGAADGDYRFSSRGVYESYLINSIIKNVTVYNPHLWTGSPFDDGTGLYGFQAGGNNNYYENIYVNGSVYSGFATGGSYNYYKNITAINTHHNAIEVHDKHSIIDGIYIANNTIHGLFSSHAPDQSNPEGINNTFKNITIYHRGNGNSAIRGYMTNNFTYENAYIDLLGGGNGYQGDNCTYTTISNVTIVNTGTAGTHYPIIWTYVTTKGPSYDSHSNTVINSYLEGSICLRSSIGNTVINTRLTSIIDDNSGWDSAYTVLYPLSFYVLNEEGQPVANAEINSSTDPFTFYGLGSETSTMYTDSTGKIKDQHLYIPYFSRNVNNVYAYYKLNVFANKNENFATLSDISPDSSWYREGPNIPTYTITAILPDEATNGPHITGFAPSEDNPFAAGESRKFQVWSDETLTTMKWYVNGNLRSSGSMVYSWEVEYGTNTIMFTGSNANGNVLQIWEVTEGEEVPVESPVSSGTGLSFTPSATSLTANTGESTTFTVDSGQEFTSALWYLDGSLVESGTTTHIENWDTAGTHTVRFDGTAAAGTISRTWTAVVSEPVESVYSSISISPSASTVTPGESFSLDVYIDPAQSLTGSQFDLHYSQLASVSSVDEGGLFSPDIFATTFEYGRIDNTLGILSQVYSAIVGSGTISQAGVMATVDMVAGSESGVLELELANVVLSDVSSNPAAYTASYATVLVDTAPEFTSITTKSVEEGQRLSFTASATDADGDPLTYTATSLPSGASFDAGTATFSWTPSEGNAGSYEAVFEVTDGYLTDTVSVSITVTPLNHAPVITLFEPADGSVFEEGSTINVNVAASDEDGQSLSYVIKIDGSQVSTTSGYAWNLDYDSAGTHTIEVTVSDGIDEVSSSGTITITDLQPRWDVNEDGIVNVLDITLIGQNYGITYTGDLPRWDVNQDATVNIQDLSIVAGHFGDTV
jgi:Putative Ig domain.